MKGVLAVLLGLLLVPTLAWAQAETTGVITGKVADESGHPLPGVKVTISGPAIQGDRTATTDQSGRFTAPFLPPGKYDVSFAYPEMQPVTYSLRVGVGEANPLEVAMKKGEGMVDTVTVYASASKMESTVGGENFNYEKSINQLPVTNRTLESVAQLAPNISFGPTPGTLSISGAPSFDTTVLLDGSEISDPYFGNSPQVYFEEAVEEVQVLTSGIGARYGRFQGGVINAVTKSGGNTFDGGVRVDLSNQDWNQRTPAKEGQTDKLNQVYSATVGGPILKDRLWFFVGGRKIPTQETSAQTALSLLDYNTTYDETRYQGKLTGAITPDHVLNLSYLKFSGDTTGYAGLPAGDSRAATGQRSDPRNITTFEYQGILTNNMFLNFQATRKRVSIEAGATDVSLGSPFLDAYGAGFQIWHNHWWDFEDPSVRDNDTASVGLTNIISTGNWGDHTIEYGVQYVNSKTAGANRQSATGFNLLNYDAVIPIASPFADVDNPTVVGANPNDPRFNLISFYDGGFSYRWVALPLGGGQELKNTAAYVQDSWQKGKLRIDAGLRWEQYKGTGPEPTLNMDFSKLAPRLGVTYNVDENWQAQATWGRYVSRFNDNVASTVTGVGGAPYVVQIYTGPTVCPIGSYCMTYADVENALRDDANWGIATTVTDVKQPTRFLADDINAPYADELNLSLKRALPRHSGTVTATYTNRRYRDLLSGFVGEQGPPITVVDPIGGGTLGDFDRTVWRNAPQARRDYNAVALTWDYRPSARWNVGGNYTFSTTEGNYEGEGRNTPASGSIIGQYPKSLVLAGAIPYGYLSDDIRHRARAWGNYTFDFGRPGSLILGAIGTYQSGLPYNLTGNLFFNDIPEYLNENGKQYVYFVDGRGNHRFGGWWALDLSARYQINIAKDFNFFAMLIVRNVTDEDAMTAFNTGGSVEVINDPATPDNPSQILFQPGGNFGKFRNSNDFQTPRSYNVSLGIQF